LGMLADLPLGKAALDAVRAPAPKAQKAVAEEDVDMSDFD